MDMHMLFMKQWLGDGLLRAICWTLLHSLWQGLILAALAGILVISTRRVSSAMRYNLLAALFFVFMGTVACTFIREVNLVPAPVAVATDPLLLPGETAPYLTFPEEPANQVYHEKTYAAQFIAYFNEHASLLVAVWFVIFLAKAVNLMGGLVYIQRIRHHKVHQPAAEWLHKVQQLVRELGIRVPVQLLESERVKVPMVTGLLKPVILLPLGLMANMPVDQVEAILLHELAHIRRRDFLVNLAQSFAEVIFFFNPAVLWLSSLLREEREHCCDDMAIAVTNNKTGYIHALVSFQEYQFDQDSNYTMAFPGKKNQLLNRVKRILDNTNKTLNMAEKSFLLICFGVMGLLTVVFSQPDKTENKKLPADLLRIAEITSASEKDRTVDAHMEENIDSSTAPLQLKFTDHDSSSLAWHPGTGDTVSIDSSAFYNRAAQYTSNATVGFYQPYKGCLLPIQPGNVITPYQQPYKPYQPYQPVVPVVPNQLNSKDTMPILEKSGAVLTGIITHTYEGKIYKINIDNNKATGLVVDGKKVPDEKLPEYIVIIRNIFKQISRDAVQATADKEALANDELQRMKEKEMQRLQSIVDAQQKELKEQKEKAEQEYRQAEKNRKAEDARFQLQEKQYLKDQKIQLEERAQLQKNVELKKQLALKPHAAMEEIIADLQRSGIIKDINPLRFTLNKSELIVNGEHQPDAVLQTFREKFVTHPSYRFTYSRQGGTTSSEVYKND